MIWLVERFLRVSVAPGTTAPVGSVTTPWIEVRNCATALEVKHSQMIAIPLIVEKPDHLLFLILPRKKSNSYSCFVHVDATSRTVAARPFGSAADGLATRRT